MAKPRAFESLAPLHQLWVLTLARADFGQCAETARIALATPRSDEGDAAFTYNALAECAVVRYSRPFTRCVLPQSRAAGKPRAPQLSTQLPPTFAERTGLPGAKTVHDAAMRLRDQFFAHSDAQEKHVKFFVTDGGGYSVLRSGAATRTVAPGNLELLERLARSLADSLAHDINRLASRVLPPLQMGNEAVVASHRNLDGGPPAEGKG
ncbi:MAG: hypothetical protein JNN30_05540 [Rhodanobacteraceae bacterium]|nr:hypothetical protein [Rhodanobacteraceae bacterium]